MASEGPYGRQGFQSNPSGYGSGGDYTQQPVYGYGGGGASYSTSPQPPSSGGYEYNPYGGDEVRKIKGHLSKKHIGLKLARGSNG